jgi:DeoR/GlpR family transcriptional regulator of sugar metabolism
MDKIYSIERKSEILKILEQNGRVGVGELSALFNSSRETIRRDLRELEDKGLLKRTHGGAVLDKTFSSTTPEFPVGAREILRFKEKDAICKSAASFIKNGDSIFGIIVPPAFILFNIFPRIFKLRLSPIRSSCLLNRWNRNIPTS